LLKKPALRGHRFELRIGESHEYKYQVDGGFLLLEALEEMVVMVRFCWNYYYSIWIKQRG